VVSLSRQEEERRRREEEMIHKREVEEQMRRQREEKYRGMGNFMESVSPLTNRILLRSVFCLIFLFVSFL
jgi:hypothetical protein